MINPTLGETYEQIQARTVHAEHLISTRYNLVTIYGCEWAEMKKSDPEVKDFLKNFQAPSRLQPRDALLGGRVEVFSVFGEATLEELFDYVDVTSLYPYVLRISEFPRGAPTVITRDFHPVDGPLLYRGLIKAEFLAPRSLRIPVLALRHESRLCFALCRSCLNLRQSHCDHEDPKDRSFIGTYCSPEVEYALSRGYKILRYVEVWNFTECSNDFYSRYIDLFMAEKYKSSSFPVGVTTTQEKEAYCEKISRSLGTTITVPDIVPSPCLRTVSKLYLNSMWGKLAEKPDKCTVEFVTIQQYNRLAWDPLFVVKHCQVINYSMVLVTYGPKAETVHSNRFSSVVHVALTTTYGRLHLIRLLEKADSGDSRLYYCDTDSVQFMYKGEHPFKDELTGELGALTVEIEEPWRIRKAVFAGCKNYALLLEDTTGKRKEKCAIRGVTLDSSAAEILTFEKMEQMVLGIANGNPETPLSISRPHIKRKLGRITTVDQTKIYQPVLEKSAHRGTDRSLVMVPFGFVEE